jgi:hypothetical protein
LKVSLNLLFSTVFLKGDMFVMKLISKFEVERYAYENTSERNRIITEMNEKGFRYYLDGKWSDSNNKVLDIVEFRKDIR